MTVLSETVQGVGGEGAEGAPRGTPEASLWWSLRSLSQASDEDVGATPRLTVVPLLSLLPSLSSRICRSWSWSLGFVHAPSRFLVSQRPRA
jgi:hypothetical protein